MPIESGVIELVAASEASGAYCYVRAEIYYDPATGAIRNVGNAALSVWNTSSLPSSVRILDHTTGQVRVVQVPGGGSADSPVYTRNANQLGRWGISSRRDVDLSISAQD